MVHACMYSFPSQDAEYSKLKIVDSVKEQFTAFLLVVQLRFKKIATIALDQRDVRLEEQRQFFEAINEVTSQIKMICC